MLVNLPCWGLYFYLVLLNKVWQMALMVSSLRKIQSSRGLLWEKPRKGLVMSGNDSWMVKLLEKKEKKSKSEDWWFLFIKLVFSSPCSICPLVLKNDKKKIVVTVNIYHTSKRRDSSLVFGFFGLKRKLMVTWKHCSKGVKFHISWNGGVTEEKSTPQYGKPVGHALL